MTSITKGLINFSRHCCITRSNYKTLRALEFKRYLEIECDFEKESVEIPAFIVQNVLENIQDKNIEKATFIVPVTETDDYTSYTTANSFFGCLGYANIIHNVQLKDKKYKIGDGLLFDSDGKLLMISTTKLDKNNLSEIYYSQLHYDIYISLSLLENVKNTVEKAVLQKILPYMIEKNSNINVHITKKMPFEQEVKNCFNNNNFTESCYEAIKEYNEKIDIRC